MLGADYDLAQTSSWQSPDVTAYVTLWRLGPRLRALKKSSPSRRPYEAIHMAPAWPGFSRLASAGLGFQAQAGTSLASVLYRSPNRELT